MGLNCSKGDLGQIEEKPSGATRTGTLGADGISFPGDAPGAAVVSGPRRAQSPGQTAAGKDSQILATASYTAHHSAAPQHPSPRTGGQITCEHTRQAAAFLGG